MREVGVLVLALAVLWGFLGLIGLVFRMIDHAFHGGR